MSETAWKRADPKELAKFDESTKVCTMNCGPSTLDPRSRKERKFLCSDCDIAEKRISNPISQDYKKMQLAFENAAKKKGYSMDKDRLGRYEDNWLQEAWEIFSLIDLKAIN